jgi:hypothetical protein
VVALNYLFSLIGVWFVARFASGNFEYSLFISGIYGGRTMKNFWLSAATVFLQLSLVAPSLAQMQISAGLRNELTGMVTVGSGSDVVIGTGTAFTTELKVGDPILIEGEEFTVTDITDDAELMISGFHAAGALNALAFTGTELWRTINANDEVSVVVDQRGELAVHTRLRVAEICDENGLNCSSPTGACPAGFTNVNDEYCIETNQQATNRSWYGAVAACTDAGAHLCSWAEWYGACRKPGLDPALLNMTNGDSEWVDEVIWETIGFFWRAGGNSCTASGFSAMTTNPTAPFRCCANR